MIAKPIATVTLGPIRSAILSAGTAPTTRPPMMGSSRMPASWGLRPSAPCEYWGSVKTRPINASPPMAARMTPQVKPLDRNNARSISGRPPASIDRWRSQPKNPTVTAAPPARIASDAGSVPPLRPSSMSP